MRSLGTRHATFAAFTAGALAGDVARGDFERRFADFVDDIVGFEANRAFASFDPIHIRARSRRLARLNSEFMNACTRLHALHQLVKRLRANGSDAVLDALAPHVDALAQRFAALRDERQRGIAPATGALLELRRFHSALPKAARASREPSRSMRPAACSTSIPRSSCCTASSANISATPTPRIARPGRSRVRALGHALRGEDQLFFVGFAFLRTIVAVGASAFWLASEWPSGPLAVIATAIACALSSTSPRAPKFVAQMSVGAAFATAVGYVFLCYVYPNIEGFPLLCAALAGARPRRVSRCGRDCPATGSASRCSSACSRTRQRDRLYTRGADQQRAGDRRRDARVLARVRGRVSYPHAVAHGPHRARPAPPWSRWRAKGRRSASRSASSRARTT